MKVTPNINEVCGYLKVAEVIPVPTILPLVEVGVTLEHFGNVLALEGDGFAADVVLVADEVEGDDLVVGVEVETPLRTIYVAEHDDPACVDHAEGVCGEVSVSGHCGAPLGWWLAGGCRSPLPDNTSGGWQLSTRKCGNVGNRKDRDEGVGR